LRTLLAQVSDTAPAPNLPVRLEPSRERPSLASIAPDATFLSQLIAEHEHLPAQRARRRAPIGTALNAYDSGGQIAVRRMPQGYRTTVLA
jgi:hypothetical protein